MARTRRVKTVKKLNLSEHTLDINVRRCNYERFRFSEIEDYVRAISGGREYQYEAVKNTMVYLWGGGYKNVSELARESFSKKPHLRERFGSEEIMLGNLPLADRLSGVVHMATGTGKSYVIFAIAYLSLVMGLTKRVLVLGPSSTIIEEGLRDKFRSFMDNQQWNNKLPREYQGKAIELLTDNDAIDDGSITIENINAIYTMGGIVDTLFKGVDEVLVLGDEIHHAYSHLNFNTNIKMMEMDREADPEKGKQTEAKTERLWMQFLRKNEKITRHIGFTGTPYNKDEYFADVIYDYNISTAIKEKFIKNIDPIINVETDDGEMQWTTDKRFAVVLDKHLENSEKYSYTRNGRRRVKPITVFYCPTQRNAQKRSEEFIRFLAKWEKEKNGAFGYESEIEQIARAKVICVISNISASEYKNELDNIEETDPDKTGGKTEFIFSVGKLLEGWDVDNVTQIVPMEERVFNSKLLISQVLGRGLRIPRNVPAGDILNNYPLLTVTNHEKFASHIKELLDAVTNSDMYILSEPLDIVEKENWRSKHHFSVYNLNYIPDVRTEAVSRENIIQPSVFKGLLLTKFDVGENVSIERIMGTDKYILRKKTISVDSLVDSIYRRFEGRAYEGIHFDFGNGDHHRCPEEGEIRDAILTAMERVDIPPNGLTEENKKQIDIYFNQFLPPGKSKRVFENIEGDVVRVNTQALDRRSVKVGDLERDVTVFISELYHEELDEKSKAVLNYLVEDRNIKRGQGEQRQLSLSYFDPTGLIDRHSEYVRTLVENDARPPYIVNTSVFKTPQSCVIVSHNPEKEFVFKLLENYKYLDSWIKSPDRGFYSISYEYWKGGRDRVRPSFNPDFFIKINIDAYIKMLRREGNNDYLGKLRDLQGKGVDTIIRVVEIKSDEDDDETTLPKENWAGAHFDSVNKKLREPLPSNFERQHIGETKQYYTFDLLKPHEFSNWFRALRAGYLQGSI